MSDLFLKSSNDDGQPRILVTESVAAKMLSISPRTLFTERTKGRIPFVKIGAAVRYRVADVETYALKQLSNQIGVSNGQQA